MFLNIITNICVKNSLEFRGFITAKKSHYHFEDSKLMKYRLKVLFGDISGRFTLNYSLYL